MVVPEFADVLVREWWTVASKKRMEMLAPSLKVSGAFSASGKSGLVVMHGTVNQQGYIGTLHQNLLPWARATFQINFVLVHDNATAILHEIHAISGGAEVEVMLWPTRSPD